ncbi:MAG: sugar transferase [Hyphomonadaceae bacterium]|nr:sugar transferase [Hyphomonadaceae bacterium]
MPRGSNDQPGSNSAEARNTFEAALRRDLASAPVVSYDAAVGGVGKRIVDAALVVLTAPIWAPLLGIVAGIAKLRHRAPVFYADERVGYGGSTFQRFNLRISAPQAIVEQVFAGDETDQGKAWRVIETQAESRQAKWVHALERLPQLLNVLRGEMAIVGPSPLSRDQLDALKSAKRHYLSARPGIVGVIAILDGHDDKHAQYKAYAMSWSFLTDAVIFWDEVRSLRNRGELWKPTHARPKADSQRAVVVRSRSSS